MRVLLTLRKTLDNHAHILSGIFKNNTEAIAEIAFSTENKSSAERGNKCPWRFLV